ncbi:EpsG family protein [Sphingomonas humi]|uniref:EpsG family protein n=1 Tax=Sphingomonas humi TaxID=335630 RepID=A0ABP7SDE6_9SPHN
MTPYWLLWTFFFAGVFLSQRQALAAADSYAPEERPGLPPMLVVGLIAMTIMIGFRYEVGGDWINYEDMFKRFAFRDFAASLTSIEPGYGLLNWAAQSLGLDIWFVNLLCAVPVVAGITALIRREPNPWLSVLLAIPYLVVVVGMGYTRQAAALGFVMIGLAGLLRNDSVLRYALWVALGTMFHKSAIVCIPLIAFTGHRSRLLDLVLLASASVGLYALLLQDSVDRLVKNYIDARYMSAGAAIRISMSVLPAIILMLFRKRFDFDEDEYKLWRNFSLVSLVAAVALLVSPSSTAVDRIALYLLPLQFVVLARIPGTLLSRGFGNALISLYSGAVLFTWLNYAVNSRTWLPYKIWFFN